MTLIEELKAYCKTRGVCDCRRILEIIDRHQSTEQGIIPNIDPGYVQWKLNQLKAQGHQSESEPLVVTMKRSKSCQSCQIAALANATMPEPLAKKPSLVSDCLNIISAVEPIAVLAYIKGVRLRHARNEKGVWIISMRAPKSIFGYRKVCQAPTYAAAESQARKYLESLPDREVR